MRRILHLFLAGLLAMAGSNAGAAEPDYPTRTLRFIVGFAPGSGTDLTARAIGTQLAELARQSVVVENRPGAAGLTAAEGIAGNGGDPYQLTYVTGSVITAALTNPGRPVDILQDLQPVIQVGDSQLMLLVNKRLPASSYREAMELFRANPGKYNYGSAGAGSATQLYMEELLDSEGVSVVHVPYKGTGPALTALMAGEIDLMFATQSISGAPVRAGQVKAVAISGERRTPGLPDVPTFAEAGNSRFNSTLISGFMINAKVDPVIVRKLNGWLNEVLQQNEVRNRLLAADMTIKGGPPERFRQAIDQDMAKQKALLAKFRLK